MRLNILSELNFLSEYSSNNAKNAEIGEMEKYM
jgi:hypothetical protein